mmetsp:Transcript_22590/g.59677  ORF Transcript_22590/g.59677 Transcript_22590/m.59677 type:complete len:215 (-) Transcript_22590:210-854(-)
MATAPSNNIDLDAYEALYQPTCVNVEGAKWSYFGYGLIFGSTVIMILQGVGVGPDTLWKHCDDCSTVLFTLELLVRVFEKGYLFFTEQEKNWNVFDSLVVSISVFSMVVSIKVEQQQQTDGPGHGGGNNAAMNKMKALRTLRLLRLLRLFKVFKGIEKVNLAVESLLNMVVNGLLGLAAVTAVVAMVTTLFVAFGLGGKAWLRTHQLPSMPKID